MKTILETVRDKALALWKKEGILNESITVVAGPLSVKEAIGEPRKQTFPSSRARKN